MPGSHLAGIIERRQRELRGELEPRPTEPLPERVPLDVIALVVGPCPCDACVWRARCSTQLLACSAYVLYAHCNPEVRWRRAPRSDASRERCERTMV